MLTDSFLHKIPANQTFQKDKPLPPVVKQKVIEVDPTIPFVDRPFKFYLLRSYLTLFDGGLHPNKIREEGIDHEWIGEQKSMQKSSSWTTEFTGGCEYQKETRFRETNPSLVLDANLVRGEREGKNQHGQFWKEDWQVNEVTGYSRWNKMTEEGPEIRSDGFRAKWGEWREEQTGLPV